MNNKNQKAFERMWAKIELNSAYGFPPVQVISYTLDKNNVPKITKEGMKNLKLIQKILNK